MKKPSKDAEQNASASDFDGRSSAAVLRRAHRMQVARQLIGRVAYDFDDVLHGVLSALDAMHRSLGQERPEDIAPLIDVASASLHKAAASSRHPLTFSHPQARHPRPINE